MPQRVTHRDPLTVGSKRQRWCGPAALSAATGYTAECAAAWINYHRGNPVGWQTKGVWMLEIAGAARSMGFHMHNWNLHLDDSGKQKTLRQLMMTLPEHFWHKPLLVQTRDHFYTLHEGLLYDNRCRAGRPWRELNGQRRVKGACEVRRRPGFKRTKLEPLPSRKRWAKPVRRYPA